MIVDDAAYAAFGKLGRGQAAPIGTKSSRTRRSPSTTTTQRRAPRRIRAPILLLASPDDRFAPFAAVEAFAARAPDARVEKLEGDHFDVYAPPLADRAAEAAAAFFSERLGAAPGSG